MCGVKMAVRLQLRDLPGGHGGPRILRCMAKCPGGGPALKMAPILAATSASFGSLAYADAGTRREGQPILSFQLPSRQSPSGWR